MPMRVADLNRCPHCTAPVNPDMERCPYCDEKIYMTSFNDLSSFSVPQVQKCRQAYQQCLVSDPANPTLNLSVGLCYLKLKLFDEAYSYFSKAMDGNFDDSEPYFYAAISLIKGKKAFLHTRPEIDRMIELVDAANSIEERGIYHYFLAYLKYDYFKRKFLNTTPNYKDYLARAQRAGCSAMDMAQIFEMMGVEKIAIV